ncbi:MAG: alpha/beta hydrolase [Micavibrio sp.]|nr:alpha/beta hydrolase [Micavibrio sp.]
MKPFEIKGHKNLESFQQIHFKKTGSGAPAIFWAHGWGQDHRAFEALSAKFPHFTHYLIDFPGHGSAPEPPEPWGTEEYASAAAALIKHQNHAQNLWIGHSFGCRVGVQIAARNPDLLQGVALIAGAGLKRKRPLWQKIYFGARIKIFKALKKLIPLGLSQEWLYSKFGSRDYRAVSPTMRATFVKIVNEDLAPQAAAITCPAQLIYGAQDRETPPELGERYNALIPNSNLVVLDNFDHYSILSAGAHQVATLLARFFENTGAK